MKTIVIIIFGISIFAVACHKDQATIITTGKGLFGKWELRHTFLNTGEIIYPAGNGNIIQFNKDSTFSFYDELTLTGHGTFHIGMSKPINGIIYPDSIFYKPAISAADVIQLKNDTLIIGSSALDGPSALYIKK